jgi:hypothetical protein
MTILIIITGLILVLLYIASNEILKIKNGLASRDDRWSENNTFYPVFSEKDVYMQYFARQEKAKEFDILLANKSDKETKEEKDKRGNVRSEWELADIEYKYMVQSNIDVLNGKRTIQEINDEYLFKFDDLRGATSNREEFVKIIDKYHKK